MWGVVRDAILVDAGGIVVLVPADCWLDVVSGSPCDFCTGPGDFAGTYSACRFHVYQVGITLYFVLYFMGSVARRPCILYFTYYILYLYFLVFCIMQPWLAYTASRLPHPPVRNTPSPPAHQLHHTHTLTRARYGTTPTDHSRAPSD